MRTDADSDVDAGYSGWFNGPYLIVWVIQWFGNGTGGVDASWADGISITGSSGINVHSAMVCIVPHQGTDTTVWI